MNRRIQQIGRHRVRYYREPHWSAGTCWVFLLTELGHQEYLGTITRTEGPRRYNGQTRKTDATLAFLGRAIKLVRQPLDSNQCGQACVATICGITFNEALMLFRQKGRTTTKQVVTALRSMGIVCGDRLRRGFPHSGGSAILKFICPEGASHWVVWHLGRCLDPALGIYDLRGDQPDLQPPPPMHVTSYLMFEPFYVP
jgi:hypothetical protein